MIPMKISKFLELIPKSKSSNQSDSLDDRIPEFLTKSGFLPIDEHSEHDIFVVGFPKSGNTWMQNLVAGILYGIDTRLLPDRLTQLIIPNVHGSSYYKRLSDLTCFKSHWLPRPEYRRVVYLVRDGRDAMVSYYHMNRASKKDDAYSLSEMVVDGSDVFPCKWHRHVRNWTENPFDAEMLVIRYEDLQRQPLTEMRRFCKFARIDRSDEVLKRSIDGNTFAMMQTKESNFGWDNDGWDPAAQFIRKGIVGAYKNEMEPDLIRAFEDESKRELLQSGYELMS